MKRIEAYERAIAENVRDVRALGFNLTMFWAYRNSKAAKTEDLNFAEVIWGEDIDPIVTACREYGIEQITISSAFSSLTKTLWELQKRGCTIGGMKMVPQTWTNYNPETGCSEQAKEPGIIINIK